MLREGRRPGAQLLGFEPTFRPDEAGTREPSCGGRIRDTVAMHEAREVSHQRRGGSRPARGRSEEVGRRVDRIGAGEYSGAARPPATRRGARLSGARRW